MLSLLVRAKNWLGPNILDAGDRARITRLNRLFLLIAGLLTLLRALGVARALPETAPLVALAALVVLASAALLWSQRLGRVKLTAYLTAGIYWLAVNLATFFSGGIDRPFYGTNVTILIFVALTLGVRVLAITTVLTVLAGGAIFVAGANGLLPALTLPTNLLVGGTTQLVNIIAAGLYLGLAAQGIQSALTLARRHARSLTEQNEVLSREIAERRLAEEKLRASEQNFEALYLTTRRQAQELALLDQVRTALAHEVELPTLMRTVVEAVAT